MTDLRFFFYGCALAVGFALLWWLIALVIVGHIERSKARDCAELCAFKKAGASHVYEGECICAAEVSP
jgi:hypothetical protein